MYALELTTVMFLLLSDGTWWSPQNVKLYQKLVFVRILVEGNLVWLKGMNYSIVMNNRIINRKLRGQHAFQSSEWWWLRCVGWMVLVESPAGSIRLASCIAASKLNMKSPWASDSATKDASPECRIPQDGRQVNKGWRKDHTAHSSHETHRYGSRCRLLRSCQVGSRSLSPQQF